MKIKLPKEKDKSEWHTWFAWYPVYVRNYGERYLVWLESIETSTLYGAMSSYETYRFKDSYSAKAFCPCGHELLQDERCVKYYVGDISNIICNICNLQTTWDLSAPVPLFIKLKE